MRVAVVSNYAEYIPEPFCRDCTLAVQLLLYYLFSCAHGGALMKMREAPARAGDARTTDEPSKRSYASA